MAGLKFQTCTVLNTLPTIVEENGAIRVTGNCDFTFVDADNSVSGYKCAGDDFKAEKVSIDFAKVLTALKPATGETGYGRIEIYTGFEGAEPAIFANALAQKGLPIWAEFVVESTTKAKALAETVKKLLENSVVMGNKLFNLAVEGTDDAAKLTIEATGEYTRIKHAKVLKLDAYTNDAKVIAESTVETKGVNGFGTYSHLIKDLRLPSEANLGWKAPNAVEMPVPGAIYNQYIINYEAPAPHKGMHAVGQKLINTTTHVFWVNQAVDTGMAFGSVFGEKLVDAKSAATAESNELED